jgi:soluble lytic murein transglycosylase-like protein
MRRPLRAKSACALAALLCCWLLPGSAGADQQRDPELKSLLQKILGTSLDCFADKFDSEVWYKTMEPRLTRFVANHDVRVEILNHVYCEAKRDPTLQMPPDLILALMEVESRFDPWAVSPAGAVGLMQVMPFWPRQLGVQNQLVRVAPNIRMGCEILRYYLRVENRNWPRALARYNGSVGHNTYPALVMQRWQRSWRF